MVSVRKFFGGAVLLAAAFGAVLWFCTKAPEYCGDKVLDTDKEFCYGGVTYAKCGGAEYSPDAEFCHAGKTVYAKCGGREYDPLSQSCERGVLMAFCGGDAEYNQATHFCYANTVYPRCDTAGYNPAAQFCRANAVYDKCGGREYDTENYKCENNALLAKCGSAFYDSSSQFCAVNTVYAKCGGRYVYDPATQTCENNAVKAQCGRDYYDPAGQFCSANTVYEKCGGQYVYDPATQTCENNAVKAQCGTGFYNPAFQFCHKDSVINKCADSIYDPAAQRCVNNILQAKCGNDYYSTATQFCAANTIYAKCDGKEYDPSGYKCDNDVLKTKCGNDYYTPATQFCALGAVYAKCNGKEYDPAGYKCDNDVLKTKCGDNGYYNPATEFCSGGTVLATCGGKNYDPTKQKCNGTSIVDMVVVTVAFNANGASGAAPSSVTKEAGEEITLPLKGALSREGYNFGGWNANAAGTGANYDAGAKYKVAGSAGSTVTFYARWVKECTITFSANNGEGTVPPITADSGKSIKLPEQGPLVRSGFNFGGWSISPSGTASDYAAGASYSVSGSATLYAKWNIMQIATVAFDANGADGAAPTSITAGIGDSIVLPYAGAMTKNGYSFGGWNTNAAGTGTNYSAATKYKINALAGTTVTLYAKWLKTFTVTFDANGGDGTVPPMTADSGASITLPAQTALGRVGYNVGGWNTSPDGGTAYAAGASYRVLGDVTLWAKWTAVQYTLTINVSPAAAAGSVTRSPIGTAFNYGTEVTLTAEAKSGYAFKEWSGAGGFTSTANPLTVTMDESKTLTATFVSGYTLTTNVISAGGGTITRSPDASFYESNALTIVTVSVTVNDGYVFTGWNGAATSKNDMTVQVVMNGNKTLTATVAKTVTIGSQTWMAENLQYGPDGCCYNGADSNCTKYGRLYAHSPNKNGTCSPSCPTGWHLPTREEWRTLVYYVGSADAGLQLKASAGWGSNTTVNGNGLDAHGFSALPGGCKDCGTYSGYQGAGGTGYWLTSSDDGYPIGVYRFTMSYSSDQVTESRGNWEDGYSVRCVMDK